MTIPANGEVVLREIRGKAMEIDAIIDPHDSDRLFALVSGEVPVRLSTDGGVSWTIRSSGLPSGTPTTPTFGSTVVKA